MYNLCDRFIASLILFLFIDWWKIVCIKYLRDFEYKIDLPWNLPSTMQINGKFPMDIFNKISQQ